MPVEQARRKRNACENCRIRKIKCCGQEPCAACTKQLLQCVFNEAGDRRRRHVSRIEKIRRQQSSSSPQNTFVAGDLQQHTEDPARNSVDPSQSSVSPGNHSHEQQWQPTGSTFSWNGQSPQQLTDPVMNTWVVGGNDHEHSLNSSITVWSPSSRTGNRPSPQDQRDSRPELIVPNSFHSPSFAQDTVPLPSFSNGNIICRLQQQQQSNSWPAELSEATLLPWLDSYFKRINPIVPVLSHISVYEAMLLGRHRTERDFGAMILAMCSIVMIQSVYTEEAANLDERTTAGRSLMQHSARMRSTWDFGQDPTIETILTSFFLFGCLFSDGQQKAAWHQLRLAVDMSCQIGLDQPDVYSLRTKQEREQRIRIYLTLAVTERACALMRRQSISLRGRPWSISLSARQMSMFYDDPLFDFDEGQSTKEIAGLLCLAHLFDGIDEIIIDCWNDRCRKTDGVCDTTDRRSVLDVTRRVMTTTDRMSAGNLPPAMGALSLNESQVVDVLMTQIWILNRLWHLSMSHGLLQDASEHPALTPEFAVALSCAASMFCQQIKLQSIEVHGMGMFEKISDIATSLQTAKILVGETRIASYVADSSLFLQGLSPCVELWRRSGIDISRVPATAEEVTSVLGNVLDSLRDGRHPYRLIRDFSI